MRTSPQAAGEIPLVAGVGVPVGDPLPPPQPTPGPYPEPYPDGDPFPNRPDPDLPGLPDPDVEPPVYSA